MAFSEGGFRFIREFGIFYLYHSDTFNAYRWFAARGSGPADDYVYRRFP